MNFQTALLDVRRNALDRAIHHAIDELNTERMMLPLANLQISA